MARSLREPTVVVEDGWVASVVREPLHGEEARPPLEQLIEARHPFEDRLAARLTSTRTPTASVR